MKLFAVIPYRRRAIGSQPKGHELPPRYDIAPMNHEAACNWVHNCTTDATGYRLTPWPDDVPHPSPPLTAERHLRP